MDRVLSNSQNFIRKSSLVNKLINLSNVDIDEGDFVIEIGPGKGIISDILADRIGDTGKLILIELDEKYYLNLKERYSHLDNVEVLNEDVINYRFPKEQFKIFSNIPFNYTSDILTKLLNPKVNLDIAYIILQREAIERWCGEQIYSNIGESLRSLLAYPFYEFSSLYNFERNDFTPAPSVDCVLIKVVKREEGLVKNKDVEEYYDFIASISQIRVGEGIWTKLFSRKQLHVLYKRYGLVKGRGIKYQNGMSVLNSFRSLMDYVDVYNRRGLKGAMKRLEQTNSLLEKEHRTR